MFRRQSIPHHLKIAQCQGRDSFGMASFDQPANHWVRTSLLVSARAASVHPKSVQETVTSLTDLEKL